MFRGQVCWSFERFPPLPNMFPISCASMTAFTKR